jgi:hypothetical protein
MRPGKGCRDNGGFRAPEWRDGFDNARHERRLLGVGATVTLGVKASPVKVAKALIYQHR